MDPDKLEQEDRVLTDALRSRLPRYPASEAFKERLAAQMRATAPASDEQRSRKLVRLAGAAVGALALAAAIALFVRVGLHPTAVAGPLVKEAVNDHLRVLYAEHPIEIESGGIHQVKPWFSGRLDFAPDVAFSGDDDFPLVGGAVGYFVDRKAAIFVWKRRLHTISLFVFRADGLPWKRAATKLGAGSADVSNDRGFHVVLWRREGLGYALVSDVDPTELVRLASKIAD